ncbi:hypothetical protein ACP275_04G157700 [Erythranthe tilingii]
MQCIPVYYYARDLNLGASGFSSHRFDSNTNYGEERVYNNVSLPLSNTNQCLGYDKTMLSQIMQNHESTFRSQVQELHRLYRRQRELMRETRARDLQSQTSESCNSLSRTTSQHATSWLLGYNIRQIPNFVAIKSREHTTFPSVFVSENSCNEVKFLPSISSTVDEKISGLELHNSSKKPCLIDLNEPAQSEPYVSVDGGSRGVDSSARFDLNCTPVSCFSEPEITTVLLDCSSSSACDQAASKGKCVEDNNPVLHPKINDDKFLKTETYIIDLNSAVVLADEPCPLKSLVGPVSPDNEECSPPRGKSEDGQLSVGPDMVAAQTLLTISCSITEPLMNSENRLFWFAEIVSSIRDNDDLEKERGVSSRSGVGPTRRTRQRKDFETAPLKRNGGRKRACVERKSTSSTLKRFSTRCKMAVVKDWGKVRKRQEGYRRRARKFVVL